MPERLYLNDDWLFSESFTKGLADGSVNTDDLKKVRLPHTV